MLSKLKLNQLYFKDTQFANLMTKRIFNVLLVAKEDIYRIYESQLALSATLYTGFHSRRNMETVGKHHVRSCYMYAWN